MNQLFPNNSSTDCSSIQIEIRIEESWINRLLSEQELVIPINEQYQLINVRLGIGDGSLFIVGDIKEKEGSTVELTARPKWDAANQRIQIEDLQLATKSKNIFLKSAGWFAKTFLNSKMDAKIEEQANLLYATQLEKLKTKPVEIQLPNAGIAQIMISSITIHELEVIQHAINVKATIDAYWKLELI